jgi:FeS assembly SUF system protein
MTESSDCGLGAPLETQAGADQPSDPRDRKIATDNIIAALRGVFDPEIPVNVFDLGLIYRIEIEAEGTVEIDMTLTAPACPVAGEMLNWVRNAVIGVDGIAAAKVNLVFDPPWDQSKMSDEAKLELGFL